MDRREALKKTALFMGTALSPSLVTGILNGCKPKPGISWEPSYFSKEQATLISRLVDIIIPKTDTPGAVDLGIPNFIEQMVKDVYNEEDNARFMTGLTNFGTDAATSFGQPFIESEDQDQINLVTSIHTDAITELKQRDEDDDYERPFILMLKELTLVGFFTTQVGAEEILQYQAVPGSYQPCISLEEAGGKTWAT